MRTLNRIEMIVATGRSTAQAIPRPVMRKM